MPRSAPYGFTRNVLELTIPVATYLNGVGQVNLILSKLLGYTALLEKVEIIPTTVGTGAGASRVINVRKGSASGTIIGTVTATLANQGVLGVVTVGTVTTAGEANRLNDQGVLPDALTVELPAGGTVFATGGINLILTFRQLAQRAA